MILSLGFASDGTGSNPETIIEDAVNASGFNVSFDIDEIQGTEILCEFYFRK